MVTRRRQIWLFFFFFCARDRSPHTRSTAGSYEYASSHHFNPSPASTSHCWGPGNRGYPGTYSSTSIHTASRPYLIPSFPTYTLYRSGGGRLSVTHPAQQDQPFLGAPSQSISTNRTVLRCYTTTLDFRWRCRKRPEKRLYPARKKGAAHP